MSYTGQIAHNFKDLTGLTFGRLTVISCESRKPKIKWLCVCVCGNKKIVASYQMKGGKTQSCGCLQRERSAESQMRHGLCRHPIYAVWHSMHARCYNPNANSYPRYGARGIKICERWHDFESFAADMLPSYKRGLWIERENNDGDYEPGNCSWKDIFVQANNTRSNVFIEYKGKKMTCAEWGRASNLSARLISRRHETGWTPEEIFETPKQKNQFV